MPSLLKMQSSVLRSVALGQNLSEVADNLCRHAEALAHGVACSILTVDLDGLLHPLAGPSLPAHYSNALDGYASGPQAGSCGTAAYRRQEVIVTDIATDPLWEVPRALAMPLGLRACWSSPIFADDGRVVATFAFYYRVRRGPSALEREIVATCVDLCAIALRHQATQDKITRLAYSDALTGLPNRAAFESHVAAALDRSVDQGLAVLYLDLDDFKSINDTLGHRVGDLLLVEVAKRIREAVSKKAFVARLGGDEFVICCELHDPVERRNIARMVLQALSLPVEVMGHRLDVSASIGVAVSPSHGRTLEELSRNADLALYEAKASGRGTQQTYSAPMGAEFQRRHELKSSLKRAIEDGELHLVYQPIILLETGQISSFEALLRWRHPTKGPISPCNFVPLAEEAGLMVDIGRWVLDRATAEAALWPENIGVAVNVSPLQLRQPGFSHEIAAALAASGLSAKRLDVEVTETALFEQTGVTRQVLKELETLGIGIALDDFGTGYSSLSLVLDRRFRKLKIDQSFVAGIGTDRDCEAIVDGVIRMARHLGLKTIAEGVERQEQVTWLTARGCHMVQGYLLGRPMSAHACREYMEARSPSR